MYSVQYNSLAVSNCYTFRTRGSILRRYYLEQRNTSHLLKSPVDEPPSRFPTGAHMETDAHLQILFYLSSRVPSKGALPPGSLHRAPTEGDAPPLEPLSAISQSPRYSPLQVAQLSPTKRDARLQSQWGTMQYLDFFSVLDLYSSDMKGSLKISPQCRNMSEIIHEFYFIECFCWLVYYQQEYCTIVATVTARASVTVTWFFQIIILKTSCRRPQKGDRNTLQRCSDRGVAQAVTWSHLSYSISGVNQVQRTSVSEQGYGLQVRISARQICV
jgi:hypothetical protein